MMSRSPCGRKRGFTLVEILIVVLIIGLLLAIAMPTFVRARNNASTKTCVGNLKQIAGAKERWAMDNNKGSEAEPDWPDLIQPGVYLKLKPECPIDGEYTIGTMSEDPECSIGDSQGEEYKHAIPGT
jgi:prepilin-type N-terminal cleavage/methylation domain-containing protein